MLNIELKFKVVDTQLGQPLVQEKLKIRHGPMETLMPATRLLIHLIHQQTMSLSQLKKQSFISIQL
jgi:hypothetical protein